MVQQRNLLVEKEYIISIDKKAREIEKAAKKLSKEHKGDVELLLWKIMDKARVIEWMRPRFRYRFDPFYTIANHPFLTPQTQGYALEHIEEMLKLIDKIAAILKIEFEQIAA